MQPDRTFPAFLLFLFLSIFACHHTAAQQPAALPDSIVRQLFFLHHPDEVPIQKFQMGLSLHLKAGKHVGGMLHFAHTLTSIFRGGGLWQGKKRRKWGAFHGLLLTQRIGVYEQRADHFAINIWPGINYTHVRAKGLTGVVGAFTGYQVRRPPLTALQQGGTINGHDTEGRRSGFVGGMNVQLGWDWQVSKSRVPLRWYVGGDLYWVLPLEGEVLRQTGLELGLIWKIWRKNAGNKLPGVKG